VRRVPHGLCVVGGSIAVRHNNGKRGMGVPGGNVRPPPVREWRPGNRSCFGRGPGFLAPLLAERRDGRGGAKKGGRRRHGENGLGQGRKTESGAGAWREQGDRRVRRGDAAGAGQLDRAWRERRAGGPQRKEGLGRGRPGRGLGRPEFGDLRISLGTEAAFDDLRKPERF
jgi:hypothetical protein